MSQLITIQSISEAHNLLGIAKPKNPLVSIFYHNDPDLKHEFGDIRVSFDLYMVALKDGVTGSLGYGRNSYDFQEGTMIFTAPGQVLTQGEKEYSDIPKGWTLLFHPDLIRKSSLGRSIDHYSFFSYDVHEALHLSDNEKKTMTELVEKVDYELNQNMDRHSQKLIVSNIELLLDYCTRYYDRQFYTRSNLNKDFVTDFEHLLKAYYETENPTKLGIPTVKYCGEELSMSPNYLSDLLKKETGKSAQEHIHLYVVDKAKTNLLGTTESVSRIAYNLGFEYPQHFSKMFKSKTGMSPAEYRGLN